MVTLPRFYFVFVGRNFVLAAVAVMRCIRFWRTGWWILLIVLQSIGAGRNYARACAARVVVSFRRLRSILCTRRMHLLTRFRQHRVGFLGGNWAIDQKTEAIVAYFRRCGFVIDNGDGHRLPVRHGLASTLQQEARLRLVSPVRDHARKSLRLSLFDGRKDVRTNFSTDGCALAGRCHRGVRFGAL